MYLRWIYVVVDIGNRYLLVDSGIPISTSNLLPGLDRV